MDGEAQAHKQLISPVKPYPSIKWEGCGRLGLVNSSIVNLCMILVLCMLSVFEFLYCACSSNSSIVSPLVLYPCW